MSSSHSPADLIFRFLQPKLIVEGQLDPRVILGVEPPGEEQIPGVGAGEAGTLQVPIACHLDGLILPVQVCEVIALC